MSGLTDRLVNRINELEARLARLESSDRKLGDIQLTLGDTAGANKLTLRNSTPSEVFSINSLGAASGAFANRVTALERELGLSVPGGYTTKDDFTATSQPGTLTFAGAPFGTPAVGRVGWGVNGTYYENSDYTLSSFLYTSSHIVANKIYMVRCLPSGAGGAGIRLDDGTDNNYVMTWLTDLGDGTCRVMRKIRTGGGAATTTNGVLLPVAFGYRLAIYYAVSGGTWTAYTYLYGYSLSFTFPTPGAVSWTPTRWGAVHNPNGEAGYSATDWLAYVP